MIINNAILHILDANSGIYVFSEEQLDLSNIKIYTFLEKHIEKIIKDPSLKVGKFNEDSKFKKVLDQYVDRTLDFNGFSKYFAEIMFESIGKSDITDSADVIICDISSGDEEYLVILKCNLKVGFVHQVLNNNGTLKNDIINYYAILPNITQKIDECVIINLHNKDIKLTEKKCFINGKDAFIFSTETLECQVGNSQKETVKIISDIAKKVTENHGANSAVTLSKLKNCIVENSEISDIFDPIQIGEDVFDSSEVMLSEYKKEIESAGIAKSVKIDKSYAVKFSKNQKIKTDTGIEISFPSDYFQNKDYIEFINNPDGTISIELKNIGKITNT